MVMTKKEFAVFTQAMQQVIESPPTYTSLHEGDPEKSSRNRVRQKSSSRIDR